MHVFLYSAKSLLFWIEGCRMGREKSRARTNKREGGRGYGQRKNKQNNNTKAAMKVMAPCRFS